MIRLLALGAVAVALSGCASRSPYQPPIVDMAGVDQNRYYTDVNQCTQLKKEPTFVGNAEFITICMEQRGYRIIDRAG